MRFTIARWMAGETRIEKTSFRRRAATLGAVVLAAAGVTAIGAQPAAAAEADIGITITESADPVTLGGAVSYTVEVSSAGPQTLQNLELFVSLTGPVASTTTEDAGCGVNSAGTAGRCALGTFPANGSVTRTFETAAAEPGEVTIEASYLASDADTDPNPANDEASETTTFADAGTDIAVGLDATAGPLLGSQIIYDLTVANQGPSNATSSTVVVDLPTQVSSVTGATPGCAYNNVTDEVTCNTGAIDNGDHYSGGFQANLGLLAIGALPATATLTGSNPADLNPGNDTSSANCTVVTSLIILCS